MRKVSINESQFNRVIIRESEEMDSVILKRALEIGKQFLKPEFSAEIENGKTQKDKYTYDAVVIRGDKGNYLGMIKPMNRGDGFIRFEYTSMMGGSTDIKTDKHNLDKYLKYAFGFITSDNRLMMSEAVDEGWLKNTAMAGAMGLATMFGGQNANAQNTNYAQQNNVTQMVNQRQNNVDESHMCPDKLANDIVKLQKTNAGVFDAFEVVSNYASYEECVRAANEEARKEYGENYYIIIGDNHQYGKTTYEAMAIPKVNNVKELINYYKKSGRSEHGSLWNVLNKDIKDKIIQQNRSLHN